MSYLEAVGWCPLNAGDQLTALASVSRAAIVVGETRVPSPAGVWAWVLLNGHEVSDRGRVPARLVEAFVPARESE
jgi:ammonia channel protein AmtB